MIEVRESAGRISFAVRVQPRASRTEISGEWQGALRIRLAVPAVEGRANDALRRVLAEYLNVPLGAVKITKGERSRSKGIEVSGATAVQVHALLSPGKHGKQPRAQKVC